METHGYVPAPKTPVLYWHITRPISFVLCVDYVGIKYVGKQHAAHLLNASKEQYEISIDWKGDSYFGLTIAWNYAGNYAETSMPGYTKKALQRFKYPEVKQVEDEPDL